jgi:hypothetical protein
VAAFAVKVPDADPAATVREAGTVRLVLLLLRAIEAPPVGAAALSVAVQTDDPGVTREDGAHAMELRTADEVTMIVLPAPLIGMIPPVAETPMVFVRPTFRVPALGSSVRLTVATIPSAICVAFIPVARQV